MADKVPLLSNVFSSTMKQIEQVEATLNVRCVKRWFSLLRYYLLRSVWHWLGLLVLLGSAIGNTYISSAIGDQLGKFYEVAAIPPGDLEGLKNVLIAVAGLFTAMAVQQGTSKTVMGALAVHCRRRITAGMHEFYYRDRNYYQLIRHYGVKNVDQQLTQDIDRLCLSYSTILGQVVASPAFIIFFWIKVSYSLNWIAPLAVFGYYMVSYVVQRFVMSPISSHTYKQEKLEGDFRHQHQQVHQFAESVAIYGGDKTEARISALILEKVLTNKSVVVKWEYLLWVLSYFFSYGATVLSYVIIAFPILLGEVSTVPSSVTATGLYDIGMLAWGFTQVSTITTSLAEFSGYVHRVGEIHEKLLGLETEQKLQKNLSSGSLSNVLSEDFAGSSAEPIVYDNVTVSDPTGTILLQGVSFTVDKDTLVMGPSGTGKTSLLRVLSSLWPSLSGTATAPSGVFFVPQQLYRPVGTIGQQIVYPNHIADVQISQSEIKSLLTQVGLDSLLTRNNLYTEVHWDFLSPGQQQKLIMARVLYHKPPVVVLDEATSYVDEASEENFYKLCKQYGIKVFSLGHRPSLIKHHQQLFSISEKHVVAAKNSRDPMLL